MAVADKNLCTECGLCCDGTLFADVELASRKEADDAEAMGLEVDSDERPALLIQPCAALKDKRCSIYKFRPKCCRTFECQLLQSVKNGSISHDEATRQIARVLQERKRRSTDTSSLNDLIQRTFFILTLLAFAASARASDWPQFRGPHRDGVWEESFQSDGLKVEWRRPVGGGWPSPVVADGRVFVFDVELIKPVAKERLHCFDEKTGKTLWVYSYEELYGDWAYVPERGAGPTATPIVEENQIYTVGANGFVHCLDVKTGQAIWEKRIGKEYELAEMSSRPSPLIEGTMLIVFTGAKPSASVMALDRQTGKEIWKALDDPVSNSSPIVIQAGGKRQLIVWSNSALSSLDPADGHVYWREPMATSGNDSAATPVIQGNRLLVSGLMIDVSADPPAAKILWPENRAPSKRVLSNTSTPILKGDYIYTARGLGELVCLEAATGNQVWTTNSITASKNGASINITPQGDGYFLFTDEGDLIRAELSPNGYREISRAHLIDPTWPFAERKYVYAPPAFANRHIFARNEGEVVCAALRIHE